MLNWRRLARSLQKGKSTWTTKSTVHLYTSGDMDDGTGGVGALVRGQKDVCGPHLGRLTGAA